MYLKHVDSLPSKSSRLSDRENNKIKELIVEFYDSPLEYAEVEFQHGEYSTNHSLYSGIKKALKTMNLPVKAEMIQGGIYLKRTE